MNDCRAIVAAFLKVAPEEITAETVIDRSALQGSIIVSRMYAKLSQAGCRVDDWRGVRTFGDLERALSGEVIAGQVTPDTPPASLAPLSQQGPAIGIDIEELANLPVAEDYREHPFYRETFTPREISHCILQGNPAASFAGLFAAKEAIVKAEGGAGRPLDRIEITHDQRGKPLADGYELSISHSGPLAVAVAIRLVDGSQDGSFDHAGKGSLSATAGDGEVSRTPYRLAFFVAAFLLLVLSLVVLINLVNRA